MCKDKDGNTKFSDTPCGDNRIKVMESATPEQDERVEYNKRIMEINRANAASGAATKPIPLLKPPPPRTAIDAVNGLKELEEMERRKRILDRREREEREQLNRNRTNRAASRAPSAYERDRQKRRCDMELNHYKNKNRIEGPECLKYRQLIGMPEQPTVIIID